MSIPTFDMKVSVIIPAYNRLHTLPRVLDSFAAQTFSDWECIVVDDHSTDATRELVLSYKEKDNRFLYSLIHAKKVRRVLVTAVLQQRRANGLHYLILMIMRILISWRNLLKR